MAAEGLPKEVQDFLISDPSWSEATRRTYRMNLLSYVRWNGGPGVSKETYLLFAQDLEKRGRASGGRRSVCQTIRAFALWGGLDAAARWKVPKGVASIRPPLTDEEFARLLGGVSKRNRVRNVFILKGLRFSGLRVSEFIRAKWKDIDLKEGTWAVPKGKGSKPRLIYLTDEGRELMTNWFSCEFPELGMDATRDLNEPISWHGTTRGVQLMFERAARKAGLGMREISVHTLRKTFITSLLREGASVETARQQAGHASLATTSVYVKFTGGEVKRDLERVGLRSK